MQTCQKCQQEFLSFITIDGKKKNLTSRKYCLKCSPYNQHNNKKLEKIIEIENEITKECSSCYQFKSIDNFYIRSKRKALMGECKTCWILRIKKHRQDLKLKCIEYKGGKCSKCGYDKCAGALDFHHLDPTQKDFTISHSNKRSLNSLKPELDKCILICANCHRELHSLE